MAILDDGMGRQSLASAIPEPAYDPLQAWKPQAQAITAPADPSKDRQDLDNLMAVGQYGGYVPTQEINNMVPPTSSSTPSSSSPAKKGSTTTPKLSDEYPFLSNAPMNFQEGGDVFVIKLKNGQTVETSDYKVAEQAFDSGLSVQEGKFHAEPIMYDETAYRKILENIQKDRLKKAELNNTTYNPNLSELDQIAALYQANQEQMPASSKDLLGLAQKEIIEELRRSGQVQLDVKSTDPLTRILAKVQQKNGVADMADLQDWLVDKYKADRHKAAPFGIGNLFRFGQPIPRPRKSGDRVPSAIPEP